MRWVGEIRLKLLVKESVMEKNQSADNRSYEWPQQSSFSTQGKPRKQPRENSKHPEKESPEMMVRSLQGIFCKGQYRSWIAFRGERQ